MRGLAVKDFASDVVIEPDEFGVDGERGAGAGSGNLALEGFEPQAVVIGNQFIHQSPSLSGFCGFAIPVLSTRRSWQFFRDRPE